MHRRSDATSTTRLFLSLRNSSRQFLVFVRLILAVCVLPAALYAQTAAPYDRDDYLPAWADTDGDCQNTRHEVLIEESRVPVLFSTSGCTVLQGLWEDPYTGLSFTNPADVDIDHMIPLKETHDSGAALWSTADKRRYANDLDNPLVLITVDDGTNSSKGNKDPARWMPPNIGYHCEYVHNWVAVKAAYGLAMDELEASFISTIMDNGSSPDPVSLASARFGQDPTIPTPARFAIGMARAAGCGYLSELSIVEPLTFTGILKSRPRSHRATGRPVRRRPRQAGVYDDEHKRQLRPLDRQCSGADTLRGRRNADRTHDRANFQRYSRRQR